MTLAINEHKCQRRAKKVIQCHIYVKKKKKKKKKKVNHIPRITKDRVGVR